MASTPQNFLNRPSGRYRRQGRFRQGAGSARCNSQAAAWLTCDAGAAATPPRAARSIPSSSALRSSCWRCFVGYYVVWSVTPALHTPLMSVTNAISSVIIVGALLASTGVQILDSGPAGPPCSASSRWSFACVNIFGGFLVTQRMLAMYKKKG
jgi:NAD(P) transhydrogenase subunit alpha